MSSTITAPSGQSVSYVDHGGPGPALVFLHSFLMDGRMFEPQLAAFGDRYRCVTIDFRGHGDTPADAGFTYWDVADDVLAVLDALGIEDAVLAGTSQGGFVALRVALLAPRRVRGLVLMGTSAGAEDPQRAAGYQALAEAWLRDGPSEALAAGVATICFGPKPLPEWQARWLTVPGAVVGRITTTLATRDGVLGRLGEITAPALVLHGDADAAYPVTEAEQLAAGLPNAEPLVVVPGGAHFLSLTDPGAVDPAVEDFLSRLGRSETLA